LPTTPDQHALDPHSQRLLKVYDLWDKPLPVDKIRDARRAYFGACSYIDANVGKLLQTLEDTGLIDDTVIVFSGDHGDMLARGASGTKCTGSMAARVPLLISARGSSRRPGQRRVSTADLLPTFVELAGGSWNQLAAGRPLAGAASARAGRA
jgi:choline-sulfatase